MDSGWLQFFEAGNFLRTNWGVTRNGGRPQSRAGELRSLHNGSDACLISRRGAESLLAVTATLALPVDVAFFGPENFRPLGPVRQLIPALCVQAQHVAGEMAFAELKSSIQPSWMRKKLSGNGSKKKRCGRANNCHPPSFAPSTGGSPARGK